MIINSVASEIDSQEKKVVVENREALKPIIGTVIFCGNMSLLYEVRNTIL